MDYREYIGVNPAYREAQKSRMPGLENGPADAYRHILGAAELTRRLGETKARIILEAHEVRGSIFGQSAAAADMDHHNNEFGIAIGKTSRTWEENVERARQAIDDAVPYDGGGTKGTAKWLDRSKWSPGGDNWPPDWDQVVPPAEDYPYGGEEHRYDGRRGSDLSPEEFAVADAMSGPLESWTDEDVKRVMRSDAYWTPAYPENKSMHEKVRAWHVRTYDRPGGGGRSGAGGGPVHVSAHVRAGAQVSDYTRARPSR